MGWIKITLCNLGFHRFKIIEIQMSKFLYGDARGMRAMRKCTRCGFIDYIRLNILMPKKDLYDDSLYFKPIIGSRKLCQEKEN